MHARITAVAIHKDKIHEATRIFHDSILPSVSGHKGFLGAYLLTDAEAGDGVSITMWDSEADGKAYEASGAYKEQVDKLRALFNSAPTLKSYTVSAHTTVPASVRS